MDDSKVYFLSLDRLLELRENGHPLTIVEVLDAEEFDKGHLPGALSLPKDEIGERAEEVLPDKSAMIVTYCASYKCQASTEAARKLMAMGYENVLDFKGSKKLWEQSGLELET